MNIYVAGPIRAGLLDEKIMQKIISTASAFGQVLTEHIFVEKNEELRDSTSSEIFIEDINWLENSTVVIAEVSTPSLGVGYEIAHAVALQKPVLCLCNENNTRLSAMIDGNPHVELITYDTLGSAQKQVELFLRKYCGN